VAGTVDSGRDVESANVEYDCWAASFTLDPIEEESLRDHPRGRRDARFPIRALDVLPFGPYLK